MLEEILQLFELDICALCSFVNVSLLNIDISLYLQIKLICILLSNLKIKFKNSKKNINF